MTRQRFDEHSTPMGLWLRQQKTLDSRTLGLDIENLDYVCFYFRAGWVMLVEEKRHGATSRPAQEDTHRLIHQMIEFASEHAPEGFSTMRGKRKIKYAGYHTLIFSGEGPEDSETIKWDNKIISKERLLEILRTCNDNL